jgi:hypothetical protein
MGKYTRLVFAGMAATLLMAFAVGTASANRLSISNRAIRAVWSELNFNAGESTIATCAVTLDGSFHSSTIAKVVKLLIGHVSRASVGPCSSGSATVLTASLPWHLTYEIYFGTLPRIIGVGVLLVGAAFRIGAIGFFCLARTTTENPARGTVEVEPGGVATGLRADEETNIPTVGSGGFGCPSPTGNFSGTGRVMLLGNTTSIIVRLI